MKSYTYKVVHWDNCPDVRVNIDVSQDLWQPYFWLRLRRKFLGGNQSDIFLCFLFSDYLATWRCLSTLTHKAGRMKDFSVSNSSVHWKQTQKTGCWEYSKELDFSRELLPIWLYHLHFWYCLSTAALLQKFTIWRNCFFFTLSSITQN